MTTTQSSHRYPIRFPGSMWDRIQACAKTQSETLGYDMDISTLLIEIIGKYLAAEELDKQYEELSIDAFKHMQFIRRERQEATDQLKAAIEQYRRTPSIAIQIPQVTPVEAVQQESAKVAKEYVEKFSGQPMEPVEKPAEKSEVLKALTQVSEKYAAYYRDYGICAQTRAGQQMPLVAQWGTETTHNRSRQKVKSRSESGDCEELKETLHKAIRSLIDSMKAQLAACAVRDYRTVKPEVEEDVLNQLKTLRRLHGDEIVADVIAYYKADLGELLSQEATDQALLRRINH